MRSALRPMESSWQVELMLDRTLFGRAAVSRVWTGEITVSGWTRADRSLASSRSRARSAPPERPGGPAATARMSTDPEGGSALAAACWYRPRSSARRPRRKPGAFAVKIRGG